MITVFSVGREAFDFLNQSKIDTKMAQKIKWSFGDWLEKEGTNLIGDEIGIPNKLAVIRSDYNHKGSTYFDVLSQLYFFQVVEQNWLMP